jgi:large subunit ribosomal protein L5
MSAETKSKNPMRRPKLEKVTVNMGVGESGKNLSNAEMLIKTLTNQKPVKTIARKTIFGVRKGEPIGCFVTLRKKAAEDFLVRALKVVGNRIHEGSFDKMGNFSFGIEDHTEFGIKYDPDVGIFGMDVCVSLARPGYRIARRKIASHKIPKSHRLTKEDSISFVREKYGVSVE